MRLIDADALLKRKMWARIWRGTIYETDARVVTVGFIQDAPTIEAEPVKHGRWIMRGGYIRCSECDAKTLYKLIGGTGGFSYELEQVRAEYCPNCGAKMDEEEEA